MKTISETIKNQTFQQKTQTQNQPANEKPKQTAEAQKKTIWEAAKMRIAKYKESGEIRCFEVPCPSKFCHKTIHAMTLDEIDEVIAGERVCHCCERSNNKSILLEKWENQTPEIFRSGETKTDIARLPEQWKEIKKWTLNGGRSLYIVGETGTCKSRMLSLLIYHRVLPELKNFILLKGGDFRESLLARYGSDSPNKELPLYKKQLVEAPLLAFDDFGQDTLTENMLAELWSILDARFSAARPTIFLSNLFPKQLKTRYPLFSLDSMIRRIEEFCDFYTISKPNK